MRSLSRSLIAASLLLTALPAISTAANPAPAPRHYLDLKQRYRLAGMGTALDIAIAPNGTVYLSNASQGRLWRLSADRLLPFAGQRRCPQGATVWPSAIASDRSGNLWLSGHRANHAQAISPTGQTLRCLALTAMRPAATGADSGDPALMLTFPTRQPTPRARPMPVNSRECIEAKRHDPGGLPDLYCIGEQQHRVTRYRHGKPLASFSLPGRYPRAAGLAQGGDGAIYLSDAASATLYRLSATLQLQYRLPLYASLLRSPSRMRVHHGELWLIDEGREQLLGEELLSLGEYQDALQVLQQGGDDAANLLLRGQAHYGLQHYPQARRDFALAAASPATQAAARFWEANTLFHLGQLSAALSAYQRIADGAGPT